MPRSPWPHTSPAHTQPTLAELLREQRSIQDELLTTQLDRQQLRLINRLFYTRLQMQAIVHGVAGMDAPDNP